MIIAEVREIGFGTVWAEAEVGVCKEEEKGCFLGK
jgi:hypothetical protein